MHTEPVVHRHIPSHVVRRLGLRQSQNLRQQRELIEQVAAAEVASDTAKIVAVIVEDASQGALAVAAVDESHSGNNQIETELPAAQTRRHSRAHIGSAFFQRHPELQLADAVGSVLARVLRAGVVREGCEGPMGRGRDQWTGAGVGGRGRIT